MYRIDYTKHKGKDSYMNEGWSYRDTSCVPLPYDTETKSILKQ